MNWNYTMDKHLKRTYFSLLLILTLVVLSPLSGQAQSSKEGFTTVDDTLLNYTILFQNKSQDTVHSIVIIDTISEFLDLSTFELGASSHPFEFSFIAERVGCWVIHDVEILPEIVGHTAGNGFVKYHIDHLEDQHSLNEIHNHALIHMNTDSNIDISGIPLNEFKHFDYDIAHKRNDLNIAILFDSETAEMDIVTPETLTDEQVTIEIFNEDGLVEFIGKLNNQQHILLNTAFLHHGHHILSVYDNKHHESWQHFSY